MTGDQRLLAGALTTRAGALAGLGRLDEALDGHRRALAVHAETGNRLGERRARALTS